MKFRAHETFFIRKGWLNKGLSQVYRNGDVFISKEVNPMDVFGIGSNMVKSLRYWMQAVGLTQEPAKGRRTQTLTTLGQSVYAHDRYIEETGTLMLLQYRLATNKDEATAWYYFFNGFNMAEFTRDNFVQGLQSFVRMTAGEEDVAIRSLNDDFACIVNTYLPRYKVNPDKVSAENNIDCPLGELGLVDILDKKAKTYRKAMPSSEMFNPWVVMAIISEQAELAGCKTEVSLSNLLSAPGNIGKVFNLDTITMLDVLYKTEKLGFIRINRTAGLDVVTLNGLPAFRECVEQYYASINPQ